MQNEILINAQPGQTRVALLEKGVFTDLYIERDGGRSMVGSVIKGVVTRVLPGMQAAFVDIGLEKAAFLYAGDYVEDLLSPAPTPEESVEEDAPPPVRGRRPRRNGNGRPPPPRIETLLREGQEIVVQVAKEPIGTKGARITSHISIPGRHLVLTPGGRVGVSRRIESDRERKRLREIVERLRPKDLGFIIRTAAEGARETDLEADIRYLTTVWDDIQIRKEEVRAPQTLYAEPSLPVRTIRDFARPETRRVVVDSEAVYEQLRDFVSKYVAAPQPRVEHYREPEPIFDHFGIEAQIDAYLGRKVWLKSGGHLIIDQSEALTAIDVNTGRFVGKSDLEETVLKTNLEAVKETVHQLRFRNIGGLIIIDLIDMESAANREKVYRALQDAIRQDKAKTNILKISELGLVEMTRKRTRENLVQQLCEPCAYCDGRGYVLSSESVAFKVLREVHKDLRRFRGRRIAVSVSPAVAAQLLSIGRESLSALGRELGREIEVRARPGLHQEQFEVTALEEGPEVPVEIRWLKPPGPSKAAREKAEAEERREAEDAAAAAGIEPSDAAAGAPAGPPVASPENAAGLGAGGAPGEAGGPAAVPGAGRRDAGSEEKAAPGVAEAARAAPAAPEPPAPEGAGRHEAQAPGAPGGGNGPEGGGTPAGLEDEAADRDEPKPLVESPRGSDLR